MLLFRGDKCIRMQMKSLAVSVERYVGKKAGLAKEVGERIMY